MTNSIPVLEVKNVIKAYASTKVLNSVSFTLNERESVALVGTSGCGKTTLLHMAGMLDSFDSGEILIDGLEVSRLSERKRTALRNKDIGFIYQFHNLLPEFSALENVLFPMWIAGVRGKKAKNKAMELLSSVDMIEYKSKKVATLSGGQAQRVAIARALANSPKIVLADEPTGNLDDINTQKVWDLLMHAVKENGASLLVVTHDMSLARKANRVAKITNGVIQEKS